MFYLNSPLPDHSPEYRLVARHVPSGISIAEKYKDRIQLYQLSSLNDKQIDSFKINSSFSSTCATDPNLGRLHLSADAQKQVEDWGYILLPHMRYLQARSDSGFQSTECDVVLTIFVNRTPDGQTLPAYACTMFMFNHDESISIYQQDREDLADLTEDQIESELNSLVSFVESSKFWRILNVSIAVPAQYNNFLDRIWPTGLTVGSLEEAVDNRMSLKIPYKNKFVHVWIEPLIHGGYTAWICGVNNPKDLLPTEAELVAVRAAVVSGIHSFMRNKAMFKGQLPVV